MRTKTLPHPLASFKDTSGAAGLRGTRNPAVLGSDILPNGYGTRDMLGFDKTFGWVFLGACSQRLVWESQWGKQELPLHSTHSSSIFTSIYKGSHAPADDKGGLSCLLISRQMCCNRSLAERLRSHLQASAKNQPRTTNDNLLSSTLNATTGPPVGLHTRTLAPKLRETSCSFGPAVKQYTARPTVEEASGICRSLDGVGVGVEMGVAAPAVLLLIVVACCCPC